MNTSSACRSALAVDAPARLDGPSEAWDDTSAVLASVCREYRARRDTGEAPDISEFCRRFPDYQAVVRMMLNVEQFLHAYPDLIEEIDDEDDGVPAWPGVWPGAGETFLGFTLLRELGRGAFARVYLAAEADLGGRLVAVKVSPGGGREAETLGRLNHPNIVPVHAVRADPESGLTAVSMTYLGTATLDDVLALAHAPPARARRARVIFAAARRGGEPAAPAAQWLRPAPILLTGSYVDGVCHLGAQLADALAYIHDLGILHRDLKPSNVLLCADGRPMLLDFNLSADERRGGGLLGGTFPYMAPEQLRAIAEAGATTEAVDARSDLFSLGVILYELLTGRRPFGSVGRGVPPAEQCRVLRERQRRGPRPPRDLAPEVRPDLARLVERLLAFRAEDRPARASDVAAALRRELAPWRRPRILAVAAVLAVVLLGTGTVAWGHRTSPPLALAHRAFREGRYDEARRQLDLVAADGSEGAEACLLAGHLYRLQGKFDAAARSYALADPDGQGAATQAALAYCLARENQLNDAIAAARRAIALGYATPEVHNNLAYCYIQSSDFEKAESALDEAHRDGRPVPPAAYHNRFLRSLHLRIAPLTPSRPAPPPDAALAQLDLALEQCPPSGELSKDAAWMCALLLDDKPELRDRVLAHLNEARRLGANVSALRSYFPIERLLGDERFKEAHREPKTPPRQPTVRLVDPVRNRD